MTSARPSNADVLERSRQRAEALAARDPEVRAAWPDEAALARLRVAASCRDALAFACEAYADRPCLIGARTLTFAGLWRRLGAVAAGMTRVGVAAGDRVGIYGFGTVEWVIADLACLAAGTVSVPIHAGTAPDDLTEILRTTQLRTIICTGSELPTVAGVRIVTVDDLERDGQGRGVRLGGSVDPDHLRTIVYTSGSGGRPKGAVFPERVWLEYWRDPARGVLPPLPGIRLACLPLGPSRDDGNSCTRWSPAA
jgi:fatty acid CoA ligase FadD9